MDNKIITVTSPLLPNLDEFNEMLKDECLDIVIKRETAKFWV
jgi:hypothetical protein